MLQNQEWLASSPAGGNDIVSQHLSHTSLSGNERSVFVLLQPLVVQLVRGCATLTSADNDTVQLLHGADVPRELALGTRILRDEILIKCLRVTNTRLRSCIPEKQKVGKYLSES